MEVTQTLCAPQTVEGKGEANVMGVVLCIAYHSDLQWPNKLNFYSKYDDILLTLEIYLPKIRERKRKPI